MKTRVADNLFRTSRGRAMVRSSPSRDSRLKAAGAFSLLEVIVASAVFFMAAFAILQLVTQGLKSAKSLQQREPDPGIILSALSLSNKLEEGSMSGNYEDLAPGMYPGYRWEAFITEVGSNGLFEVNVMTYSLPLGLAGPRLHRVMIRCLRSFQVSGPALISDLNSGKHRMNSRRCFQKCSLRNSGFLQAMRRHRHLQRAWEPS